MYNTYVCEYAVCALCIMHIIYRIAGKFGEFGKSFVIRQTKPSKLVLTINNLLADLLIRQTFFRQMLETSQFAKFSPHQTFLLYGIVYCYEIHS